MKVTQSYFWLVQEEVELMSRVVDPKKEINGSSISFIYRLEKHRHYVMWHSPKSISARRVGIFHDRGIL